MDSILYVIPQYSPRTDVISGLLRFYCSATFCSFLVTVLDQCYFLYFYNVLNDDGYSSEIHYTRIDNATSVKDINLISYIAAALISTTALDSETTLYRWSVKVRLADDQSTRIGFLALNFKMYEYDGYAPSHVWYNS